jgi:hypothetical protein
VGVTLVWWTPQAGAPGGEVRLLAFRVNPRGDASGCSEGDAWSCELSARGGGGVTATQEGRKARQCAGPDCVAVQYNLYSICCPNLRAYWLGGAWNTCRWKQAEEYCEETMCTACSSICARCSCWGKGMCEATNSEICAQQATPSRLCDTHQQAASPVGQRSTLGLLMLLPRR